MKNEEIIKIICEIGKDVSNNLEDWKVKFSLDYLKYNEITLAAETILSYIYEDDIKISQNTYKKILMLNKMLNKKIDLKTLDGIKKLCVIFVSPFRNSLMSGNMSRPMGWELSR